MTRFEDLYNHLKDAECPPETFRAVRDKYAARVASNRQLERCRTVGDVLRALRKRDEISEDDHEILEELFLLLRDDGDVAAGAGPLQDPSPQGVQLLPTVPAELSERLQLVIGMKIGHNWKQFARGLGIPEGYVDALEERHRNISDRVRDILVYHQQLCPRNFWRTYLYEALCRARRRDLANEVQFIIDMHKVF